MLSILGGWFASSFINREAHGGCEGPVCLLCGSDRRVDPWYFVGFGHHVRFSCHGCLGGDCGNMVCPSFIREWRDAVCYWQSCVSSQAGALAAEV